MKLMITILTFSCFSTFLRGQNGSFFYNKEGQLKADSSKTISLHTLKYFERYEHELADTIIKYVFYPEICAENDVSSKIILELSIDSLAQVNLSKIYFQKGFKQDPYIEKSVNIVFSNKLHLTKKENTDKLVIYIPVFYEIVKDNATKKTDKGSIVVQTNKRIFYKDGTETHQEIFK